MKTLSSVVVALLAISSTAHATIEGADNRLGLQVRAGVPVGLQDFSTPPVGIESKYLQSPYYIGISYDKPAEKGAIFPSASLIIGIPRLPIRPIIDGSVGVYSNNEKMLFGFVIDVDVQTLLTKAPLGDTYLDTWRIAPGLKFQTQDTYKIGAEFKWFWSPNATIASFEGIDTKVNHGPTLMLRPSIATSFSFLKVESALGIYALGPVTIASKEFGHQTGQRFALQPRLGAGIALPHNTELWVFGDAAVTTRANDTIEYLYQVPFYSDRLSQKATITAEIRMNL
jgi:hypothetical protein